MLTQAPCFCKSPLHENCFVANIVFPLELLAGPTFLGQPLLLSFGLEPAKVLLKLRPLTVPGIRNFLFDKRPEVLVELALRRSELLLLDDRTEIALKGESLGLGLGKRSLDVYFAQSRRSDIAKLRHFRSAELASRLEGGRDCCRSFWGYLTGIVELQHLRGRELTAWLWPRSGLRWEADGGKLLRREAVVRVCWRC